MTRLAIVEKEKCNPISCDWLCFRLCPINRTGKECITKKQKAVIDEELCTGCSICSNRCPFQAIQIINLPEKLKESPIHRYGKNAFELFHLPIIKRNTVVGIIGRNGIGKSTALEILSGNIKPNLGSYEKPPKEEQVIETYSTSYLADYFKELFSKKIKISYKPQRIELIPKLYKGKIIDLIKKIDEKQLGLKLLEELDLESIKDRNIKDLSGGELQRLAIIAASIKKADIYYFDEPASFLDITHRIKVAKLIRGLAEDSTVMVVEHDLATLDYISDEIQIIYGAPVAYGIISQSKSVRRGINEYLDGYLPDDNIRFRDYAIKFSEIPKQRLSAEKLLEFPSLEKSYDKFSLKTSSGIVHKGEVMAVMGANGLGKTTFLKLLAGLEKPDKGKVEKFSIAYKPQYLPASDETVYDFLKSAPDFNSGWYKTNIMDKLNIKKILNNKINTLSGGELQKVHIAKTLSSNAKILAFDEPSAFVDIEDRLKVAEIIKDFVFKKEACAIVVDHDIQFIDYLADSLLVFEGVPAKEGRVFGPCDKKEGMNRVLKMLNITYRKDKLTNRPRINKPNSQLDIEQRQRGEFYY